MNITASGNDLRSLIGLSCQEVDALNVDSGEKLKRGPSRGHKG